jgi:hypothetical protein
VTLIFAVAVVRITPAAPAWGGVRFVATGLLGGGRAGRRSIARIAREGER